MADIDKVIKGLEHCTSEESACEKCDYWEHNRVEDDPYCGDVLMRDALELLKEQQKRIDVLENVRDILTKKINYHNCNTCKAECEIRPLPGEYVRTNCMLWTGKDNEDGEKDDRVRLCL